MFALREMQEIKIRQSFVFTEGPLLLWILLHLQIIIIDKCVMGNG